MPFAGYSDFEACTRANSDKRDPAAYCAAIKRQVEGKEHGTVKFNNVGGDPFQDSDTLEDFIDALLDAGADRVLLGDEEWPDVDGIHDRPVIAEGIDLDEAESVWEEFQEDAVAIGGPQVKLDEEPVHVEDFKLNEAELFGLAEKTDEWTMEDGMWVNEKESLVVYTPEAGPDGGNPGGNAPETGKQGFETDIYEVIGGDDMEGQLIGIAVDFPNAETYVDWKNDEWPEDEQLDDSHVSIYGSVDDLVQATGNEVNHVETIDLESSDTKADSDDPAEPGEESVDTTESDDTTNSVVIKGLSDEALEAIERKYSVEVEDAA